MKIAINNDFIYKIFLLSIIVGNTIVISFARPFEMDSRNFSVPYRIFIVIFSLYIIYKNRQSFSGKSLSVISLIAFWVYYIIKLKYSFDNHFFNQEIVSSQIEYIFRIVFIVLLPSIALISINYREVDLKSVAKYGIIILCGLLAINYLLYGFTKLDYMFSTYYIMYGHIGATLFIISLFILLFFRKDYNLFVILFCLFLGLFNVVQSTARSPLLAISVCSFYMVVLKGKKEYFVYSFVVITLFLSLIFLHEQYGNEQIKSFNRMFNWMANGDTSGREPLYTGAVDIFYSNPLFGGRILYEDGVHPHNIFLELLMATGITGLILYFLKFLPVLNNFALFWNIKKGNIYYKLIFALFLQYFTLVQTSCNLFSIPEFLYFSSIIIGISYTAKTEEFVTVAQSEVELS